MFGNKYISFTSPKNPTPQRITTADVDRRDGGDHRVQHAVRDGASDVAQQVDPVKLNQTLTATAQALDGLGDRFGQSIVNGNEILADINPQMPQIRQRQPAAGRSRRRVRQRGARPVRRSGERGDDRAHPQRAAGQHRPGADGRGRVRQHRRRHLRDAAGPYLVRGAADLVPTVAAARRPTAPRCSARSATTTTSSPRSPRRSAATATRCGRTSELMIGAGNPYVYPDNLPRVNARGGPEGRPGCWQPITRDLWPAPYLVMDTGASIAPYNHFELGQPHPDRVRLGTPDRGEHDQPMKITGTAIKLGIFSLVLLLFTAIIIVVFGQMRFDRTTGYSAIFSNASGLRAGQFVRASGVEVGKVSKVELIDGGTGCEVDFNVDRVAAAVPGRRPRPIRYLNLIGDRYLELKRGDERQAPARRRHHPARAHRARARPRRVDRRVPAAVPGAGPRQGQQHRPVDHHDLPGPGRHHQRHPGPDRVS